MTRIMTRKEAEELLDYLNTGHTSDLKRKEVKEIQEQFPDIELDWEKYE